MAYDEATAERIRRILADRDDVAEKAMMGGLSFMVGGTMCCSVSGRGGLLVRVDPEARTRLLREPHAQPADIGARRMTGFIRVGPDGYGTEATLRKWVEIGLAAQPAKAPPKSRGKATKRR
jgi:TfoX/Sxy family transcriptional regulator of competence genes